MKNRINIVENITSSDVNFEKVETRFDQTDNRAIEEPFSNGKSFI